MLRSPCRQPVGIVYHRVQVHIGYHRVLAAGKENDHLVDLQGDGVSTLEDAAWQFL